MSITKLDSMQIYPFNEDESLAEVSLYEWILSQIKDILDKNFTNERLIAKEIQQLHLANRQLPLQHIINKCQKSIIAAMPSQALTSPEITITFQEIISTVEQVTTQQIEIRTSVSTKKGR